MKIETEKYLTCIDGLKGIGAIIIAFMWHYQHFGPQHGNPFGSVFKLSYEIGFCMTFLFFMISGFGMMLGYGHKVLNKEISFRVFFLRRLKKMYPIFIFSTVLTFFLEIIYAYVGGQTFVYSNFDIYHVVQNMLFIQDGILGTEFSLNAPSWCISICLVCYCLFYYVIYKLEDAIQIIYSFSIIAILSAALIASGLEMPILNSMIGKGVANFSIGVLLFFLYNNRTRFNSAKLGYCCLVFLVLSYIVMRLVSVEYAGDITLVMTLGFGPILILSTLFIPWMRSIFGSVLLKFFGTISLEIYLLHFPTQCCIKIVDIFFGLELNYSSKYVWIAYVVITIGISTVYHFLLSQKIESFVLNFFSIKSIRKK